MAFSIPGALLYLLSLLLTFWIPVAVLLFSFHILVAESRRRHPHNGIANATKLLLLICGALWLFLFAEYHSKIRITLFDLAAPLFSLVALFTIPFLLPLSLYTETNRSHPRKLSLLSGTFFLLAAISMVPGAYLLWYYAARIVSGH